MNDFSNFPFDSLTTKELGRLFIDSIRAGDKDFADACREQVKKRKPDYVPPAQNAPSAPQTGGVQHGTRKREKAKINAAYPPDY